MMDDLGHDGYALVFALREDANRPKGHVGLACPVSAQRAGNQRVDMV